LTRRHVALGRRNVCPERFQCVARSNWQHDGTQREVK
jgi:hypothetical protein